MGKGRTYADIGAVGAEQADLLLIDLLVEVLELLLGRDRVVELLGDGRVGLGVDLLGGQFLGHLERNCGGKRSESDWCFDASSEGWFENCGNARESKH